MSDASEGAPDKPVPLGRAALVADHSLAGLPLCRAYSALVDEWLAQLFEGAVGAAERQPGELSLIHI